MLPRWYLVVFIICLIAILIVSSYNIYENFRIKKKCPRSCQESQDILIGLNIIIIVLTFILLMGYWFIGDDTPKPPVAVPTLAVAPVAVGPVAVGPTSNGLPNTMQSPMTNGSPHAIFASPQALQYLLASNYMPNMTQPTVETCSPFSGTEWKSVDVAQKI